jgi:hypothetical protein
MGLISKLRVSIVLPPGATHKEDEWDASWGVLEKRNLTSA